MRDLLGILLISSELWRAGFAFAGQPKTAFYIKIHVSTTLSEEKCQKSHSQNVSLRGPLLSIEDITFPILQIYFIEFLFLKATLQ